MTVLPGSSATSVEQIAHGRSGTVEAANLFDGIASARATL